MLSGRREVTINGCWKVLYIYLYSIECLQQLSTVWDIRKNEAVISSYKNAQMDQERFQQELNKALNLRNVKIAKMTEGTKRRFC